MWGLWKEANEFFSSTSIHGLPYISNTQSRSTRIIWTIIVLGGFGVTSYFLYNTVCGFDEKYVTTTRSIHEYPFPAITFHPGNYNSKDAFKKIFLNQLNFHHFNHYDPIQDSENAYLYQWLLNPQNENFLNDIEKNSVLLISSGWGLGDLKDETDYTCSLLALHEKNIYFVDKMGTLNYVL